MSSISRISAAPPRPRPTNIEEFLQLAKSNSEYFAAQERASGVPTAPELQVDPSDILIATYPKCGTTWVQQIVHGLRTRGAMDFADIGDVIPWIETAPLVGVDLDRPQGSTPRAFKTHLPWNEVPAGARYIYVIRDPGDALLSLYNFERDVFFDGDGIDVTAYGIRIFVNCETWSMGYWQHLRSWWAARHLEDVLFLCFEDMKLDLEKTIRRIACFMGIAADEELISLVERQASFAFMRAHEHRFNEQKVIDALLQLSGLAHGNSVTKLRTGRVGDGAKVLPQEVRIALAQAWEREISGPLGYQSYDDLRASLGQSIT